MVFVTEHVTYFALSGIQLCFIFACIKNDVKIVFQKLFIYTKDEYMWSITMFIFVCFKKSVKFVFQGFFLYIKQEHVTYKTLNIYETI